MVLDTKSDDRLLSKLTMCLIAVFLLTLPLGIVGFCRYDYATRRTTPCDYVNATYRTLQLFGLNSETLKEKHIPPILHGARFLAALVPLGVLIEFITVLTKLWRRFQSGRPSRLSRHAVVFGDGPIAVRLASDATHDRNVVFVGPEDVATSVTPAGGGACLPVSSSAARNPPVETVAIQRAQQIAIASADDGANIATALRIEAHLKRLGLGDRIPCDLHVVDPGLRHLLTKHRFFTDPTSPLEVTTFDVYENCARTLLDAHPIDRGPITASSTAVVRLVVVGLGRMGESLLVRAAKLGHFANERPLEVIVVDAEAPRREQALLHRYPAIRDVCTLTFREQRVTGPESAHDVARLLVDRDRVTTLALCIDDDTLNTTLALEVLHGFRHENVLVLARLSSEDGLATLLRVEDVAKRGALHPFSVLGPSVSHTIVHQPRLDALAMTIHEDFIARRARDSIAGDDPSRRPWDLLGPDFKDSNRQQADHIAVKLRAIGCEAVPPGQDTIPFQGFADAEVELLARMEHNRWNAERWLAGWRRGDTKDEIARTSPHLVPWDRLSNEVQGWDREFVRNIPTLVATTKRVIRR